MRFLERLLIMCVVLVLSLCALKALGLRTYVRQSTASENRGESSFIECLPLFDTADAESLINLDALLPWEIRVNRALNRVVIYGVDMDGVYSIPYRGFVCSTGREGCETPLGTFSTSDYYEWRKMVDGSYAQYAIRFHKGWLLHSVPYYSASKDNLETAEYNKLGSCASLGCVRLAVADIKWIYDNCSKGTTVLIYDDADEIMPVQFDNPARISAGCPHGGWDPTDPDERNPWKLNDK